MSRLAVVVVAVVTLPSVSCSVPDAPAAPTRSGIERSAGSTPDGLVPDSTFDLNGAREFEITLSDDDPTLKLGTFVDVDYGQCGPCKVLTIGPSVPRTIQLSWTADLTLYAWIEGENKTGTTVTVHALSGGSNFGLGLRIDRIFGWGLVSNLRLKIGLPETVPRSRLGGPVRIRVMASV
jgi:hypothetical protein